MNQKVFLKQGIEAAELGPVLLKGGTVDLCGNVISISSELRLVCPSNASLCLVVRNGAFKLSAGARVSFEGFAAVELCDVCFAVEDDAAPSPGLSSVLQLIFCRRAVLTRVKITAGVCGSQHLLECRGFPHPPKKRSWLCGLSMFSCNLCGLRTPGAARGALLSHLQCVRIFSLEICNISGRQTVGVDVSSCTNCVIDGLRVLSLQGVEALAWSFEERCKNCVLYEPCARLCDWRVSSDSEVYICDGASLSMMASSKRDGAVPTVFNT